MVIVDSHTILKAEPGIVVGVLWVRRDVREDGKNEFVWEADNCAGGVRF